MIAYSIYDIIHDIMHDIMILYMISRCCCSLTGVKQRSNAVDDGGHDADRQMDFDEERDFAVYFVVDLCF